MASRSPLIDVHSHFVTPEYVEAAVKAGHTAPDGMPNWPQWSPDDHLRLMDKHGIEKAVLSISSPGVHFGDDNMAHLLATRVNDFAAELCESRPDRFLFFASLPMPAVDESMKELSRSLDELGASGVIMESNAHGRYLGDTGFEQLWQALDERAATVFIHPTSPPGWQTTALGLPRPMMEFLFDSTRTVVDLVFSGVVTRYPDLDIIVPHCGAMLPVLADRITMFEALSKLEANDKDVEPSLSFSETIKGLWYDLAGAPIPTQASVLIDQVGTGNLLYGSDYCWTPPALVDRQIASLDGGWDAVCATPWRELATLNAQKLLGLPT